MGEYISVSSQRDAEKADIEQVGGGGSPAAGVCFQRHGRWEGVGGVDLSCRAVCAMLRRCGPAPPLAQERLEQLKGPVAQARELEELAQIYVARGLPYNLVGLPAAPPAPTCGRSWSRMLGSMAGAPPGASACCWCGSDSCPGSACACRPARWLRC